MKSFIGFRFVQESMTLIVFEQTVESSNAYAVRAYQQVTARSATVGLYHVC